MYPTWTAYASTFVTDYLTGQPYNTSAAAEATATAGGFNVIAGDGRETEDCLFLDVMVPKKIFDRSRRSSLAPVLVWIYGGGYTGGEKANEKPNGLLRRSNNGIVYVALNYRLGALGWLSGATFQDGGTANAGLHDQRFALEWVQQNIHLFGGDKDRVTIIGESAGGGSVMHQITVSLHAACNPSETCSSC